MTRRAASTFVLLFGCAVATAQQSAPPAEGKNAAGYNIQQSIEFGWLAVDSSGNQSVFDTFVNRHTGPRLFAQSLTMHSLDHHALLFDDLSLISSGYGGEPNDASRLRMSKNHWYNFNANFRRDENVWNYNLLANPLNPPTSSPALLVLNSPHRFATVRRMGDYSLILAPQSPVRVRVGYGSNSSNGPSFSSVNVGGFQGAQTLLFQPWHEWQSSYQMGVDFRMLPRTNISFDEFLQYRNGSSSQVDRNFGFQSPPGTPIDLGLVFNTPFSPCAAPVANLAATPPVANPICNAFQNYLRSGATRTSVPTEQASFQSAYFKPLEITGLFTYSSFKSTVPALDELFQGFLLAQNLRQQNVSGHARARNVTVTGELSGTWRFNERLRVSNSFRLRDFRVPGAMSNLETTLFAASQLNAPTSFNPAQCSNNPATCPPHTLGSQADLIAEAANQFLGKKERSNLLDLQYEPSSYFGGHVGHRYVGRRIEQRGLLSDLELFLPSFANRDDCANQALNRDGTCGITTTLSLFQNPNIHQNSIVLGIWARPLRETLRLNFDVEILAADHTFTRMDPRQSQRYRFHAAYQPAKWAQITAVAGATEANNHALDVRMLQHNRSFNVSALLAPGQRWAFDLSYDFSSIYSRSLICYISSALPANAELCPTDSGLFAQTSFYRSATHFGSAAFMWKPQQRVTANLGYHVSSVDGSALLLDPLAVQGSLRSSYHQPTAALEVRLQRNLFSKAAWNYYGYGEQGLAGPSLPRNFHANLATVSLRYAF